MKTAAATSSGMSMTEAYPAALGTSSACPAYQGAPVHYEQAVRAGFRV